MGTESRGELTRVDRAGLTVNRHFGEQSSVTHRVAAGSAVVIAGGGAATGLMVAGMAVGPHLVGVLTAAEPGMIGLAAAGAAALLVNGMAASDINVTQHSLNNLGPGYYLDDLRQEWAVKTANARSAGVTLNRGLGIGGLLGSGVLATTAAGLDLAGAISGHTAAGMGGGAEILAALGVTGLVGARFWRGQAAKHGSRPERSLGE